MLKFLIEKECKQIFRNSFIPKLLVAFPLMAMLVFPWAATMEIKHINIHILDLDHSRLSQRLIHKIEASTYFNLTGLAASNSEAMNVIELGKADIILEIRPDFERQLIHEGAAKVMISSNAVNGIKGGLGASYLAGILQEYARELRSEQAPAISPAPIPVIEVIDQYRFNPHLNYQIFMIPALMVMILTMICGFLPALNIVGEKEAGTIEQMNVTPVSRFAFILAKLIPYWLAGILICTLCFGIAALVYGLTNAGSFLTIYFFAAIYILVVSGIGLIISNYSSTLQQAMFVMFFFMMVMILISGLFTPVTSMPKWAQAITIINPLKYFIQVMRAVYLKGSGIIDLLSPLAALITYALFANVWAVLSYRKTA
ncbi:MAG: ABC transporter permease [Bacteroidales bacterium]|nr:ABC transporter permease [Bacteroidales bacterium]